MDDVIIKKTPVTPLIEFLFSKGSFRISGIIDPQDPSLFFEGLVLKFEGYLSEDINASTLEIEPIYVRGSSIPWLFRILEKFAELKEHGQDVTVIWKTRQEDEVLIELGKDLAQRTLTEFHFIETN